MPKFHNHTLKELLKLPKSIKIIGIVIFVYYIGWGIVTPFFPLFLKEQLGDYASVGLVTGLLSFFAFFWSLLLGSILDSLSKRRVISFALLIYFPFSYFLLKLNSLAQFITFRIYHSFSSTSFWLASETYVRTHSPKNKTAEAFSLYDFSSSSALVIGAVLGAYLIIHFGFNIMYAISIFGILGFFMSIFLPDHQKDNLQVLKLKNFTLEFSHFYQNKKLVRLTIFAFLFVFGSSFLGMILPLFLKDSGASYFEIGLIGAAYYLPFLFEPYFAAMKSKFKVFYSGLLATLPLFLILFFMKNIFLIFLVSLLMGLAFSATTPILLGRFTNLMPKKETGQLSGIVFGLRQLAAFFSPLLAGIISDQFGLKFVFLFGFLVFLILILKVKWFVSDDLGDSKEKISQLKVRTSAKTL